MYEKMYENPQGFSGYSCDGYDSCPHKGACSSHMMHEDRYKPEHKHHNQRYESYPHYHSGYKRSQVKQMLTYLKPAIHHCMWEVENKGVKHAVEEGALLGYLMGKGCDFQEAVYLVESGETNGVFKW